MKKVEEMKYYLKDIEGYEIPLIAEEKDLFRRIKNNDKNALDELVRRYSMEVIGASEEIFSYLKGAQIEDLIQEGYIGLVRAINIYTNSDSKTRFTFVARKEIRKSIIKYIKSNIELMSNITNDDFKKEVLSTLTEEQSLELEERSNKKVVSLETLLSNSDIEENGFSRPKYLEDAVTNKVANDELFKRIEESENLSDKEKLVLLDYFRLQGTVEDPLEEIARIREARKAYIETLFYVGGEKLIQEIRFDENTTEFVNERKKQKQREQHSDKIEIINLEPEELNYDELELERLKKEIEILESKRNALLSSPNIDSDAREIGYKKLSEELESKRARVLKIVNRIDELKRRKAQREEKYKKRSTLKKDSIYDERPDLDTLTSDNKPRQFTYYLVEPDPELVKELESAILEERTQLTKVIGIRQRLQQIIANVSSFTSYEQYTSEKKKQKALYEEAANLLEEKKSKVRTIRREVELSKLPKESKDYLSYGEQIEELQTKKKDTFSNRLRRNIDAQIEMLKQQRRVAKSFLANAGIYGYTQKVYRMPRC